MASVRDLLVRIRADNVEVDRELSRSARSIRRFGQDMQRVGSTLSTRLTLPLLAAAGASVKVASDFEETGAKFDAVFRHMAGEVRGFASELAEGLGRSEADLQGFLATLQDTFVPLGFARERAAEMSKTVAQLVLDVAAFNNEAEPETLRNFTSALVGNHEAVRRYGVVITQATLKQELMTMGIRGGVQAATEQEKAQARLNILLRQTADAQGTAAREAGGFAAGMRGVAAATKDLGIFLGEQLLPVANQFVRSITSMLRGVTEMNPELIRWGIAIGAVAAALGPATLALGTLTAAVAFMANQLAVGLLPLIGIGGPVLVGLGLLAAAFVKVKLDAAAAATEMENFQRSLASMTPEELAATMEEIVAKQRELRGTLRDLGEAADLAREKGLGKTTLNPILLRIDQTREQLGLLARSFLEVKAAQERLAAGDTTTTTTTTGVDSDAVAKATERLEDQLRIASRLSDVLGSGFDLAAAKASAYRAALESVTAELGAEHPLVKELASNYQLWNEQVEITTEATKAFQQAMAEANAQKKEAEGLLQSIQTPQEAYSEQVARINELHEAGNLTLEQRNRLLAHAAEVLAEAESEFGQAERAGVRFADQLAFTLSTALQDGQASFKRFADFVIAELGRIAAKMVIFEIISQLLPGSKFASALGQSWGFGLPSASGVPGGGPSLPAGVGQLGTAASQSGPDASRVFRLDVSGMPPPMDPRQAARDGDWLRFLSDSTRNMRANGG